VHLAQGGNSAANLSANTGNPGSGGPSGAQSTTSQATLIPQAFNGTWSGLVTQPPSDTYNLSVTMAAHQPTGSISYSLPTTGSCQGEITPTAVSSTEMVVKIVIIQGRSRCGDGGMATLTLKGPGALAFVEDQGASATGTLNHQ